MIRSRISTPPSRASTVPGAVPRVALPLALPVAAALAVALSVLLAPLAQAQTLLASGSASSAGALQAPDPVVGQVSLLIGEARLVRRDGSVVVLRQGGSIAVGDRIETTSNGHVHVRFVDNAVVSVRPESVLEVQAYRFDAANPQSNEVRLKVAQGVSRSISGQATDADKSRFRLNTPIAAIGVRGTDFIVQASASDARATVASGAIVMSPLGNGCVAESLGPCSGRAAQLLSAEMGRLMVELRNGERTPRVVPAADHLLASSTPSIESRAATRATAMATVQALASDAGATLNDRAAADLLSVVPLSSVDARQLQAPPDRDAQLAWGRYYGTKSPYEKTVLSLAEAANGRNVTIGDWQIGLFRRGDPMQAEAALNAQTGTKVDFRLTRAEATFEVASRTEAATIEGGTFSVDFLNRRFGTALSLSSATAGKSELRAAGSINGTGEAAGLFRVKDSTVDLNGAISLDGKEAGYMFTQLTSGGMFRGRTLWGR